MIFSNNIGIQSIVRYDMMGMCNGIMRYVYIYTLTVVYVYVYTYKHIYIYVQHKKRIGFLNHT